MCAGCLESIPWTEYAGKSENFLQRTSSNVRSTGKYYGTNHVLYCKNGAIVTASIET